MSTLVVALITTALAGNDQLGAPRSYPDSYPNYNWLSRAVRKFTDQFDPNQPSGQWSCPEELPSEGSACGSDQAGLECQFDIATATCSGDGFLGELGSWEVDYYSYGRESDEDSADDEVLASSEETTPEAETDWTRRSESSVNTPRKPRPNPGHKGCRDAWDCPGESHYCYKGSGGRKNYCKFGDGIGSLCRDHSGCGWLGRGKTARKMRCHKGRCRDTRSRRLDQGKDSEDAAVKATTQQPEGDSDEEENAKNAATEEGSEQDAGLGSGLGADEAENVIVVEDDDSATKDDSEDRRRGDSTVYTPRPKSPRPAPRRPRHQCYNAWDCPGVGEYCYQGWNGNYCQYNSGVGSICQRDSDCGWLGYQQMYCNWGQCQAGWRRLDDDTTADAPAEPTKEDTTTTPAPAKNVGEEEAENNSSGLGSGLDAEIIIIVEDVPATLGDAPEHETGHEDAETTTKDGSDERRRGDNANRPHSGSDVGVNSPRPAPRPRPRHECYNAWDCPGVGEYCYRGWNGNRCRYDSGINSICQRDSDCGWLGYTQMFCRRGRCRRGRY